MEGWKEKDTQVDESVGPSPTKQLSGPGVEERGNETPPDAELRYTYRGKSFRVVLVWLMCTKERKGWVEGGFNPVTD